MPTGCISISQNTFRQQQLPFYSPDGSSGAHAHKGSYENHNYSMKTVPVVTLISLPRTQQTAIIIYARRAYH